MDWYLMCLKKFADFSGRSRRKEYWMFALINTLIGLFFVIIQIPISLMELKYNPIIWLSTIYSIGIIIPSLSVTVRRLHDTDRSGLFYFLVFLPIIGGIILFVFLIEDSRPGKNKYGLNPKEIEFLRAE